MKKIFLLMMVALMSLSVNAQSVVKPGEKYKVYCKITCYNSMGFGKVKVALDMGRNAKVGDFETIYKDGKQRKFTTMMEVVNYMTKRGWKMFSTYVDGPLQVIMEKEVTDDSQIDEGLELGAAEK